MRLEEAVCTQPLRFPPRDADSDAPPVSDAARRLLESMLTKEPAARATLEAIARDAWVTDHGAESPVALEASGETHGVRARR